MHVLVRFHEIREVSYPVRVTTYDSLSVRRRVRQSEKPIQAERMSRSTITAIRAALANAAGMGSTDLMLRAGIPDNAGWPLMREVPRRAAIAKAAE